MGKSKELTIRIRGMHCAGCAAGIEKRLSKVEGVTRVQVNFTTETAAVDYEPSVLDKENIFDKITEIGYRPEPAAIIPDISDDESNDARGRLFLSLIFTVPIILLNAFEMITGTLLFPIHINGLILFILTVPVLFYAGRGILFDACKQAAHLSANMNTLISIGSLAAFIYSISVLMDMMIGRVNAPGLLYFETTAMIITLILLGRYLESLARVRTLEGISSLIGLRSQNATVIINNIETTVDAAALKPGMTVMVRPGEKVPADGKIIEGEPSIDESMLTGESVPAEKKLGDKVIGGSINGNAAFRFEVTGSGEDTFLAGIIRLVSEAQNRKAPVQRLADRIAGIFVPIILLIAAGTFTLWFLFDRSSSMLLTAPVAVLIIACPCAMGLATPTAVLAGTGRAARRGIYFRGGDILERTVKATHIVFDKTGTLTKGVFEVLSAKSADSDDNTELVRMAASVETGSGHPLARAIVDYAADRGIKTLPVKDITEFPGLGVRGTIGDREILVGSYERMEKEKIDFNPLKPDAEEDMLKGRTVVFVATDGHALGYLALADRVKDEAAAVIDIIQKSGYEAIILTGDNYRTASGVAAQLGVGRFEAGIKPDQKALMVEVLRRAGNIVIMVGDGINDAPALAAADIGVALGSGADAAIESADIILVRDNLETLVEALSISKLTYKTIKQNLFWAFFYNILAVPLAAGLFYPLFGWSLSPVVAAAAMAFSSLLVVSNSMRLLKVKSI